jgi:hypothetical protein
MLRGSRPSMLWVMALHLRLARSSIAWTLVMLLAAACGGSPIGDGAQPSTITGGGGGGGQGSGTGGQSGGGQPTSQPTSCTSQQTQPPLSCFPSGIGPNGPPAPERITGVVHWTWEGGGAKTVEGEHHETLDISVQLQLKAEFVGVPFENWVEYEDAGSTWNYSGKVVFKQDPLPGGCGTDLVISSEANGSGDFQTDDGFIVARVDGDDPSSADDRPGMLLGVTQPGVATMGTTTICGTTTEEPGEMSGASLMCDELRDAFFGDWVANGSIWQFDFGCTSGHITESGTLTGS